MQYIGSFQKPASRLYIRSAEHGLYYHENPTSRFGDPTKKRLRDPPHGRTRSEATNIMAPDS